MKLEWHQHFSFLKSRAPTEYRSIASEHIFSSVCLRCSSNSSARQMKGGYYAIDVEWNIQSIHKSGGSEGEETGERGGRGVDEVLGGSRGRLYPAPWCSSASSAWLVWRGRHSGAAGLTSTVTQTPPPAINLTQLWAPTLPRLWAADRDEARSRETGDVRG